MGVKDKKTFRNMKNKNQLSIEKIIIEYGKKNTL